MKEPGQDWVDKAHQLRLECAYDHNLKEGAQVARQIEHCLEHAIESGNTNAMLELAGIFRDYAKAVLPKNKERSLERAVALERKAAAAGNLDAILLLGDKSWKNRELFLAQDWYYLAATKGSTEACISLSRIETQWGDHEKAGLWTALAMNGLEGDLPEKTTPDDFDESISESSKNTDAVAQNSPAEQVDPEQQFVKDSLTIGDSYWEQGKLFLAQDWWYEAASRGSREACMNLAELETEWGHHEKASAWTSLVINFNSGPIPAKSVPEESSDGTPKRPTMELAGKGGEPDLATKPQERLIRNYREAEALARDYLIHFGFDDAEVTADGADGGIDVDSTDAVAQVKFQALPVGRPVVQGLLGVASHLKKEAFFFSSSGYTSSAIEFAEEAGISLFKFALNGGISAVSEQALSYWDSNDDDE